MTKAQSHVRALEALDVEKETYSQLLVPMLTKKIPHSLMIHMSKQMKKKLGILETLLINLQDELEARERVPPEAKLISESKFHTQRRVPAQGKRNMSTASALFASEKRKTLVSCKYCKQAHPSHTYQRQSINNLVLRAICVPEPHPTKYLLAVKPFVERQQIPWR